MAWDNGNKPKSNRIDVGAGWKKSGDRGDYIALSFKQVDVDGVDLSQCWVSLTKNNRKKEAKHPDYIVSAEPKQDAKPKQRQQEPPDDDFGF